MQSDLFQQGVDLMVFGMGTVFIFLTTLVVFVYAMSSIISRFFAQEEPQIVDPPVSSLGLNVGSVDPAILAVIQDAIYQHRAKNQP